MQLIESRSPPGMLSLLDEQCMFPKATDETFVEKIASTYSKHPFLIVKKKRKAKTEFTILHFAGEVTYNASGFLEKNKDKVIPTNSFFHNLIQLF